MVDSNWSGQALPEYISDDGLRAQIKDTFSQNTALSISMSFTLSYYLLSVARRGNSKKLQIFVEEGFPLTFQDELTGATVLHILAAGGARKGLRVVLKSDKIDFLLRDKQGRLPSEMAYLYGRDVAIAKLLGIKEQKQAAAQEIRLTRRPV